jgi:hypothetical protein
MPRPHLLIRPVSLHTHLPEDIHARLMLHLYSPGEGKVPKGAVQAFLVERISEFFSNYKEPANGN